LYSFFDLTHFKDLLRAEMEKYFRSIFGSNDENFKICFRDYLTFSNLIKEAPYFEEGLWVNRYKTA